MAKKILKSRKRKEQTIAIVIVAAVVLIATAALLIFAASQNENLNEHDHDHDHDHTHATELTLKVAVDAYEGEVHYNAAKKFEEQIESKTGGAVQVELYAKGKLGDNEALITSLEENQNVVDILIAPVADFTTLDERMDISMQPFMFSDMDAAWDFMNGEIQEEIENALLEKNIRVLTHYRGETSCILSSSKVINTVYDIQGMKVAMTDDSSVKHVLQLMGANAVVLNENAASQALLQKQCDAYMGTLSDISESRLYQGQSYLALTYHSYEGLAFAISENTWKSLGEYQDVVEELAKSSAYTGKTLLEQEEKTMLENIKNSGVRILYPKMSSFQQDAESYLRTNSSKYGTLIDRHLMNQKSK